MADNTPQNGTANVTSDEVTYSGDTTQTQIVQVAFVAGSEGSRTIAKAPGDATDGLLVNLGANNDVTVSGVATAANQSSELTLAGAVTETAPASDTASSGLNGRLQRIAQRITSLIALVPASLGAKAAASSFAVTQSTEDAAQLGSLTETAPASDTASSGLNGRLQRVAQRLTSLIALLPAALGQGTMAQSLRVVLPSDQASIPVAATAAATEVHLGEVGGRTIVVRTEVTRPSNATAYTANDAIGNTGTAASWAFVIARIAAGSGVIQAVLAATDQSTCTARLEIDYYSADTAAIIADNAEATRLYTNQANFLGSILLPAMAKKTTSSNLAEAQNITDRLGFKAAASSTIFGVVRTLDAFTPASAQKISISHVVLQD